MTDKQLRVPDYLGHILLAIERIERYTEDMDEQAFLVDELVQDAVIRNIEVIGEAANNIERADAGFAQQYPELPLAVAYKMRNRVAHGYFKIDLELVWKTVQNDLPVLAEQVRNVSALLTQSRSS
jgi:uncharacterized protein with HEPN domain